MDVSLLVKRMVFAVSFFLCIIFGADIVHAAQAVPVLMYHHILPDEDNINYQENACVISLESFAEQMKYLHDNQFTTLTSTDIAGYLYDKKPLPDKSVWITFDDGYQSNFVYAYPILKEYGFKATIFVITGSIFPEKKEFNPNKAEYASIPEMELSADVFEYSGHTDNMHYLVKWITPALLVEPKEKILQDLEKNFAFPLIKNKTSFSYPFGAFNDATIECLKNTGVKVAVTVNEGYVYQDSNPYTLTRYNMFRGISLDRFIQIVNLKM